MVDLSGLEADNIADVFMLSDIAMFNGNNKVTFTVLTSELISSENKITMAAVIPISASEH